MYNSSPVYSPMSGELQSYSPKKKQSNAGSLGNRMAGNEELNKYLNRSKQTNFINYTPGASLGRSSSNNQSSGLDLSDPVTSTPASSTLSYENDKYADLRDGQGVIRKLGPNGEDNIGQGREQDSGAIDFRGNKVQVLDEDSETAAIARFNSPSTTYQNTPDMSAAEAGSRDAIAWYNKMQRDAGRPGMQIGY